MSDYDAAAEMEAYERLLPPRWKTVACPTCGVDAGEQCGRRPLGVPWGWDHVKPHAARKRAVNSKAGVLR
jgi:hypothetical protein